MIQLIDLKEQFLSLKHEILKEMENVLESGQYILGPKVSELEKNISNKLGTLDAIAVANGTDALVLTLDAYGIGENDEVITSPFTFFASAEAISRVGAIPVFVDVDPITYTIDPLKIEEKITPSTKAIIPVHIFGQTADMDEIMELANKYNLIVIEDACQAFGATYKGKPAGSLGHAACFSFFPTKNLGTLGDGGMITTSNLEIANKIRKLRTHGTKIKYYHDSIGYNSRLDEIHAAILLVCLEKIDLWNQKRKMLADRYNHHLSQSTFKLPMAKTDRTHIYHLYCIGSENREKYLQMLHKKQIHSGIYYPQCLHLQEVYSDLSYKQGDFPIAESLSETLFALPMSPFLSEKDQDTVISALIDEVNN
ncbi:DegT/DnrJ/EryC1/StrS family aminotransferase [Bacillus sp. Gen3]|uniref:DegT/DnrJ/EryC1/StrS family aminotransferase n=1 Tax=Heyndrickxia oleronia TaxID=38875 RepID=UPI0007174223|nr:DegT/DnrJ/EryC1/StrS family aminotransferase [Heyndrickxia oleronia]MBU5211737.1 DegT/DnrJ/EryC1/StrS family aminotransferase [Heyndrickxia oleronia]NYV67791.1 DegT/DnrJ/EryC1/StrS family aminotransferase [Bacillus sp. Gen3]